MSDIFDVLDDPAAPAAPEWVHWYVWETFTGERALDHIDGLENTPFEAKRSCDIRRAKTRNYRRHGFSARRARAQTQRTQPSSYRAPCHRRVFVGPQMPAERG